MPNREEEKLPELLQALREQGDGLSSPEADYFAALAKRSIAQAKAPATQRFLGGRWLAGAASVLVLMLAGWWMLQPSVSVDEAVAGQATTVSSEEILAEINIDDIDAYVSEQIDEFTQELYEEAPLKE